MATRQLMLDTLEQGQGILRLIPVFVPRRFSQPGRRLRLHPDDYFALGTERGAIKERWFSSVIAAMNGPLAPSDEGMSYVLPLNNRQEDKFTLNEIVAELGELLIGTELQQRFGNWPIYSKFFDYKEPLFHHLHLCDEDARRVGRIGKPECYYYPPQMNNYPGTFPVTYFGFEPDVTREMVRDRLLRYERGDNRITELSRAYRIELGTGWYTPPGVVHAPGSYLTYEPQWNSDVNSVYENIASGEVYPYDFLVENCPLEEKNNIDYVLDLMDWPANTDPHYKKHYFRPPITIAGNNERYCEKWIAYANDYIGAKELTIYPGQSITLYDPIAFGCIVIQGQGTIAGYPAESATMLRYGQNSADEFFVSEAASRAGISYKNNSLYEPMVLLKHFGPNHPEMPLSIGE